jgi:DNA-binding response OmpR family regulator
VDEQSDSLILIVEDDEATKGFLADNLAADGFRVASASTGCAPPTASRPASIPTSL